MPKTLAPLFTAKGRQEACGKLAPLEFTTTSDGFKYEPSSDLYTDAQVLHLLTLARPIRLEHVNTVRPKTKKDSSPILTYPADLTIGTFVSSANTVKTDSESEADFTTINLATDLGFCRVQSLVGHRENIVALKMKLLTTKASGFCGARTAFALLSKPECLQWLLSRKITRIGFAGTTFNGSYFEGRDLYVELYYFQRKQSRGWRWKLSGDRWVHVLPNGIWFPYVPRVE